MACCALAAFLISQMIFALDWARERLGVADAELKRGNAVVAWRLDGVVASGPALATPRGGRTTFRLGLAAGGGLLAFVLLAALTLESPAGARTLQAAAWICTGHGLERFADLRAG